MSWVSKKLHQKRVAYWRDEARANLSILKSDRREHLADGRECMRTIRLQGKLLTGAVNALRGLPPPNTLWSHHDVVKLIRDLQEQNQGLAVFHRKHARTLKREIKKQQALAADSFKRGVNVAAELALQFCESGQVLSYRVDDLINCKLNQTRRKKPRADRRKGVKL